MLKNIYLGLQARIIEAGNGIKHFDWYNRQYEEPENQKAHLSPAVFVEFMPLEMERLTHRVQKAQLQFRLHLVTRNAAADPRAGSASQLKALEHLDQVDALSKLLEGYRYQVETTPGEFSQVFNSITRTLIEPDHEQDGFIVTRITFTCTAFDYSLIKVLVKKEN